MRLVPNWPVSLFINYQKSGAANRKLSLHKQTHYELIYFCPQ